MGSSISGILAISYIDQLENQALMLISSSEEATTIYEKF